MRLPYAPEAIKATDLAKWLIPYPAGWIRGCCLSARWWCPGRPSKHCTDACSTLRRPPCHYAAYAAAHAAQCAASNSCRTSVLHTRGSTTSLRRAKLPWLGPCPATQQLRPRHGFLNPAITPSHPAKWQVPPLLLAGVSIRVCPQIRRDSGLPGAGGTLLSEDMRAAQEPISWRRRALLAGPLSLSRSERTPPPPAQPVQHECQRCSFGAQQVYPAFLVTTNSGVSCAAFCCNVPQ